MPNRLDIELTSVRGDGSYTWRAAGARQPKGVIDSKILADNAKVGDVLRVEAEVEIDGITILAVLPPKEKATPSGRIELLASSKSVPAVTTVLLSEGGRGGDRRDLLDSPRRGGRTGSRDRPARGGERPDARRPQPAAGALEAAGERRPERRPRPEGAPTGGSSRTAEGRPATSGGERRPRTVGTGARHPGTLGGDQSRTDTRQLAASRSAQPQAAPRRTIPRFEPGTEHRDLLIASLAPEQRPIAERLAAGGIPAVRRAIAVERERARAEGRPEATGEAILALAEQLAPSVKQATWLDRAEAAVAQLDQISLRDLRTTVAAAAPRDETTRELDRTLREELDRRVKKLRSNWEEQITHALEEGRVLQALRFSAQPPEPTARFPAALVESLANSAGAAMSASTPVERWLAILDAAVTSPIRRQIHPAGLPEDASGEVVRKARVAAGSLPALAPMLGLSMPPPPKPLRPTRPPRPARPPRSTARAPQPAVLAGATMSVEAPADALPVEAPADEMAEAPADALPVEAPADEVAETPADALPVEAPADALPVEAPADEVAETPADALPVEAPADEVAEAPADALPVEAPADAVAEAPADALPVEAPADAVAEAPADALPVEAPADAVAEAPADALPVEAPADVVAEAPADVMPVEALADALPVEAPADVVAEAPADVMAVEAPADVPSPSADLQG